MSVDGPKYDCTVADDVDYLDVAATHDQGAGTVTVFLINRHLTEAADLRMALTGFEGATLIDHQVLAGHDLRATNGPGSEPIAPAPGQGVAVEHGTLGGSLAPLSYHMVRLKV